MFCVVTKWNYSWWSVLNYFRRRSKASMEYYFGSAILVHKNCFATGLHINEGLSDIGLVCLCEGNARLFL